jgi:hypothetical protein
MCRKREANLNQIVSNTLKEADDLVGFLRLRALTASTWKIWGQLVCKRDDIQSNNGDWSSSPILLGGDFFKWL